MNRLRIAFGTLMLAGLLLPVLSNAQTPDGTIEASWNRAPSAHSSRHHVVPPPPPTREAVKPRPVRGEHADAEYTDGAWEKQRGGTSRPWPSLSAHPTQHEYYDVNTAVIDSLAHLYCLSTNYIGTLRIRNQQAHQGQEPAARQFDYDGKPAASTQGRQSLQALHKELLSLLDRCLVGR
ncbi:MAG: hypothetical protein KFF77_10740 [Bacteroidetes bacterium]|nr:hypothetical protein [Bacteroidota bacterium]